MVYLVPAIQGLLAVVLLISGASKLRSGQALRAFAGALTTMRLVPGSLAGPVAAAVGTAEVSVAALLAVPAAGQAGFAAGAALLAVLTAGVAVVLARGTAVPCRCFGASSIPLAGRHLLRNILLTGAALAGLAAPAGRPALAGWLIALLAGALAGLLVTVLDDLVALFARSSVEENELL